MNKKMDNKGFSLVELIIVIAIMAILVGVLAPQFIKYIESSRQSTDISAASEYKSAVEAYVADHGDETPGDIVVHINATGIYADANLADVGLADNASAATTLTKWKSSGWPASATATYNTTSFKWTTGSGSDDINNTKEPKKNMAGAFR